MREYEQRDVKIGVILALAPPQVQNHCRLNTHILRTMLFDYCRAQADTAAGDAVPMDLSLLGKDKKGEGDKKGKGKGKKGKGEGNKDEKDTGKGKGKHNAKTT